MKRIGIDCDGVIASFTEGYFKIAKTLFNLDLKPEMQTDWDYSCLGLSKQEDNAIWTQIKNSKDWWLTLNPLDGTSLLKYTNFRDKKVEPVFITSRAPTLGLTVREQTGTWLKDWFKIAYPFVIEAPNPKQKTPIVKALEVECFIDDKPSTVIQLHEAGVRSYVKLAPYNSQKPYPEGVIPVETLNEFLEKEL